MNYQIISQRLPDTSVIEQVLINRGIQPSEIRHYLNTTKKDILDPSIIQNIDKGVKLLIFHISQGHKIFIQIDSDCDGYTSAALLINYLNSLFPGFVQNNISYRVHGSEETITVTQEEFINLIKNKIEKKEV